MWGILLPLLQHLFFICVLAFCHPRVSSWTPVACSQTLAPFFPRARLSSAQVPGEAGVVAHTLFSVCRRHSKTRMSVRALTADLPRQVSPSG